jgi:hypothetical protein
MRPPKVSAVLVALLASARAVYGQGFCNLDFEDATIVADPARQSRVYADQAIPGWMAYSGTVQLTSLFYNTIAIGSTDVSIVDQQGGPSSLDGVYSVYLSGGAEGPTKSATIRQTGVVPASARSITFNARYYGSPGGLLYITLGGENISFATLSSNASYTQFGGAIPTTLAGQDAELVFSAPTRYTTDNDWLIDDIKFSPISIPEPTFTSLVATAAVCLRAAGKQFNPRTQRTRDDDNIS